jgi:uncharacterized integral membrane protein
MSSVPPNRRADLTQPNGRKEISPRFWGGLVVLVVVVVFIAINQDDAQVSLVFAEVTMSLWLALTIAGVLGFAAGWLIGRRRR